MLELATMEDRAAVERLAKQVHEQHVSWRPDIYRMPEELFPLDRFREALRERQLYVAKLDGLVVGYALLRMRAVDQPMLTPRKVMLIDEFCVEEALRGHGIGTAMMGDVKALARAFRCTDLQLSVYPQNDEAVSFYQKMGLMIQSINMQMKV